MERDLLMLSQRLMPLSSMVPTVMLPHTDMDTHMPMGMVSLVRSNNNETISIGIWVSISVWGSITVGTIEESGISLWLSISRSLSIDIGSASVTGGLGVWGAHSWPVGVSVEEGRGNQDTWVSLSRDADSDGSSNQKLVHFEIFVRMTTH